MKKKNPVEITCVILIKKIAYLGSGLTSIAGCYQPKPPIVLKR